MSSGESEYVVSFPTIGFLVADWVEAHCVIPDREDAGAPFILSGWQLWNIVNHYRIKPTATVGQLAPAFYYRRSQTVRPQKTGKGPFTAAVICVEAVGPAVFAGWARVGDVYDCAEHGCDCGFVYEYELGEPMGKPWSTPLIQITATSEEQTDNIYAALRPMIDLGPLHDLIPRTGEEFIRLPNGGRIDTVTSKANSRLGQRVTFVAQDETQLWTQSNGMTKVARTQRRGLAGMGGRAWETTNAWDPSENSVAQQTSESAVTDVFKDFPQAPAHLRYETNKADRRKIHRYVYAGSPWVDLDAIEAEANEIAERDPGEAARFFGNRLVYAKGTWLPDGRWDSTQEERTVDLGTPVCGGFDGSENNDFTAIRLETADGFSFTPTYGPDDRPTIWNPEEWGGQIPRSEVHAAIDEIAERYELGRFYCDPEDWRSEIGEWALKYGEKVFVEWATNRPKAMHAALRRVEIDLTTGRLTHDGCPITETHVANARKRAQPGQTYTLIKPADHQKIDAAMSTTLAHEAACDAVASGWGEEVDTTVLVFR